MDQTANASALPITLLLGGVIGMLLLAVSLVLFFVVYQRRILEQQRLRLKEERRHQQELLQAAIEVQEQERSRIASDLHDEIGSKLSAVRLFLGQLVVDQEIENNVALKKDSLEILGDILNSARRITHDLFPPELAKFGLFAAVEDLCDKIDRSGKMMMTSEVAMPDGVDVDSVRLPRKTELALYRVLQEMLNNTIKHANALNVTINFYRQENRLFFNYQDDGTGLEMNVLKPGLGLKNIETRVTLVGGKFEFISAPGHGLRLEVNVPISHWKKPDGPRE